MKIGLDIGKVLKGLTEWVEWMGFIRKVQHVLGFKKGLLEEKLKMGGSRTV